MRFVLLALVLFAAGDAAACSCLLAGDPIDAAAKQAAVFRAKAIASETVIVEIDRAQTPRHIAVLQVLEAFRGDLAPFVVVPTNAGSCAYVFESGKTYVVFAEWTRERELTTSRCSFTAEESEAEELLPRLRKAYPPAVPLFARRCPVHPSDVLPEAAAGLHDLVVRVKLRQPGAEEDCGPGEESACAACERLVFGALERLTSIAGDEAAKAAVALVLDERLDWDASHGLMLGFYVTRMQSRVLPHLRPHVQRSWHARRIVECIESGHPCL